MDTEDTQQRIPPNTIYIHAMTKKYTSQNDNNTHFDIVENMINIMDGSFKCPSKTDMH